MALAFADVIPKLLEVASLNPLLKRASRIAVIRDRKGLVRLAVEVDQTTDSECNNLEAQLAKALGGWYSGPPLFTNSSNSGKSLAKAILDKAQDKWPENWPTEVTDPIRGTSIAIDRSRFGAIQRVLSKESWLTKQTTTSPWPLHEKTPTIASFYSYKGGVGRSTLVAIVAAILARAGSNVVIVDLDLEAPGQQTLFDAQPSRGVLDYIVEYVALGTAELNGLLTDVTPQVPDVTGSIRLAAAGAVDWAYVEKVARLDFAAYTHQPDDQSPVHDALASLLSDIRVTTKPDWILLDARTGIHDLGGLAMHAFAHIDVLLARNGRQGIEGLRLCLQALARRRDSSDIRTLIVHALAPAPLEDDVVSVPVQRAFQNNIYELFKETLYESLDDTEIPSPDDLGAAHSAHPIPLDPTLGRLETLRSMIDVGTRSYYTDIVERLRELAEPEEDST